MLTWLKKRSGFMSEKYDVIVAGGGPSGLAAAVSAARLGARTAVIEKNGVLGGNLTSGHVGPIMGSTDKGTMTEEICDLLKVGGPQRMHDVEWAKMALPRWVSDAGVDIYVQTQVADAIMEGNTIRGLVIAGKNGLEEIYGDVVVDATGDGLAAYCAGAEYGMGRPGD
ncbi:MAG TPA: FAD-dependent oxidoreductase, partial [Clostridiales bacterium]|nr:FAD-dependent oxidoreductase [Clostridiales bacterium]